MTADNRLDDGLDDRPDDRLDGLAAPAPLPDPSTATHDQPATSPAVQ